MNEQHFRSRLTAELDLVGHGRDVTQEARRAGMRRIRRLRTVRVATALAPVVVLALVVSSTDIVGSGHEPSSPVVAPSPATQPASSGLSRHRRVLTAILPEMTGRIDLHNQEADGRSGQFSLMLPQGNLQFEVKASDDPHAGLLAECEARLSTRCATSRHETWEYHTAVIADEAGQKRGFVNGTDGRGSITIMLSAETGSKDFPLTVRQMVGLAIALDETALLRDLATSVAQ